MRVLVSLGKKLRTYRVLLASWLFVLVRLCQSNSQGMTYTYIPYTKNWTLYNQSFR